MSCFGSISLSTFIRILIPVNVCQGPLELRCAKQQSALRTLHRSWFCWRTVTLFVDGISGQECGSRKLSVYYYWLPKPEHLSELEGYKTKASVTVDNHLESKTRYRILNFKQPTCKPACPRHQTTPQSNRRSNWECTESLLHRARSWAGRTG